MTWEGITLVVGGVGGFILSALALRRSMKVDAISAQSGAANASREGTAQIITGLNLIISQYQEDNKNFREDAKWLTSRLDAVIKERDELRLELAQIRKKYGDTN